VLSSRTRVVAFAALASLTAPFVFVAPTAVAVDTPSSPTIVNAISWLESVQESDGGFELSNFPGFETPDAILVIAEGAQTDSTWSTEEAFAAVTSLQFGGSGPTPLDAIDDWIATGVNAGEASKIIALVGEPLGIDPTDFGAANTDLAALVYPSGCGASPSTGGLFFNELLFVAIAGYLLCGAPDAAILTTIRDGQRADGGWNFLGDPDDVSDSDGDTTTLALQALIAGGAAWNDPAVLSGLSFVAAQQSASGAFRSFGSDDPNATATSMFATATARYDPSTSCWRDTAVPSSAGMAYGDPAAWLRSQQLPDGRIASPNDGFGVSTFATSQSVQGLLLSWWPVTSTTGAPTCPVPPPRPPPPPSTETAAPVVIEPRFTG
jgi:hypothetical protein